MVGPDTLARGLDAGAAGFLVKPVSVARLHQVFQLALSA
jgi:DNA-binding NarL/FixJ family response regulator